MTKTEQLVNALRIRFAGVYKRDNNYVDALVMGYLKGMLQVLEESDDALASSLDFHLQDCLEYNAKQSRFQEAA